MIEKFRVTVPAGQSVANAMAGKRFATINRPSIVEFYMIASGSGISQGEVTATATLGNALMFEDAVVDVPTEAIIDRDRNFVDRGAAAVLDQVALKLSNSDGVNDADVDVLVDVKTL